MRLGPKTKDGAGWLLEAPRNVLWVKSTTFQLHPMHCKSGDGTNDTFIQSRYTNPESLVLPPQKLIVFDSSHPIESRQPGHYYQPIHRPQASFDSFIHDKAGSQITMFQITDGRSHLLKPSDISLLLQRMERLGLPTPILRFIAVIPAGDQVECVFTKARDFSLETFCLEVTEEALFGDNP
jgi:hypothetical protein